MVGRGRGLRFAVLALFGAILIVACGGDAGAEASAGGAASQEGDVAETTIESPPEVLVAMDSDLIGQVSGIELGEDGRIYIADAQAHVVHILDASGDVEATVGREGQGPGEFLGPSALRLHADSLLVVDTGNQRIQRFTPDGDVLDSRPLPFGRGFVIGADGTMARPTQGFDSILALVFTPEGEERARIGEMAAPLENPIVLSRMREEIANGGIPGIMLNSAMPLIDEEGMVWLLTAATGLLEKYDHAGNRLIRMTLEEAEFAPVRGRFVEQNAEAVPNRVFSLRYILAADVAGTDLWLLLNTGEEGPATVLVVSGEGEVERKLRFTGVAGAGSLAVDTERELIYFSIPERAELVRVSFGGAESG